MNTPSPAGARLVTMLIVANKDGTLTSDVQTHDNSYAEVARGLGAIKGEIDRVFAERKSCPHYPATPEDANKKILRAALAAASLERIALSKDQEFALRQTLDFLRRQEGQTHQGYYYHGWAGEQLRSILPDPAIEAEHGITLAQKGDVNG